MASRQKLIAAIDRAWRRSPELRFGQLLRNVVSRTLDAATADDLGSVDDDQLLGALEACWAEDCERPATEMAGPYWDPSAPGGSFLSGRPRDPARIEPFLKTLEAAWAEVPESSLTDLIVSASAGARIASIEDHSLEQQLAQRAARAG